MPKFAFRPTLDVQRDQVTARVGDGPTTSNPLGQNDKGKFVKFIGDSLYGLCAVGNEIEGILDEANEAGDLTDGYVLGSVNRSGRHRVTFDGLQSTPGTGTIVVGDYVVCGTIVARGTALGTAYPKVCKATAAGADIAYKWRVVSFDGTGAVGQTGVIEKVQ